ncbi:sensor histidine kinase [Agarilytica rhodophyticola]|uniref:sensor histidine kinase n=1 Tax=Agarilytica rhodophyticola TaxID=1737490 RepID=UPI0013153AAA|nr:HAMP domain-containing sensor histidine kinase [Agarilytica rhodophyticola]
MFLAQTKKLVSSSNFRFTFYVMGSAWLIFTVVLVMLYQISLVTLWETSVMENQELEAIENVLYSKDAPDSFAAKEKALQEIKQQRNLQFTIINYDDHALRDIEGAIYVENEVVENYEPSFFHSFLSRFILPESYNFEFPIDDTKLISITMSDESFLRAKGVLKSALISFIIATFLLFLLAMFYYTKRTVNRINDINQTCNNIIQGNLGKRVPLTRHNDDYDSLAENINIMLDKIQSLLQGVQQISDNIAHDLRTPLTHLRNKLEHLEYEDEEKQKLIASADNILSLFNSILSITKLEFHTMEVTKQEVDMDTLIYDLVELYEPIAEEKNIRLLSSLNPLVVKANKDLIFQALSNLIENAIKYSRKDGDISIKVEKLVDNTHLITIQDSGEGIPIEEQKAVFRRMYRAEKHRGSVGHGLGLTMTKAILDHHQWKIQLQNIANGLQIKIHIPPTLMKT